jgi:hypothetical protein
MWEKFKRWLKGAARRAAETRKGGTTFPSAA